MKTMRRHSERTNWEGGTRAHHWEAREAAQRATCRAATTTAFLKARPRSLILSCQTRIQRKTRRWRATARSLTGGSRWSSALRAASGCTSPVPRWRGPPSQTSGTAPSARPKVQKEGRRHAREPRREKMHRPPPLTGFWGRPTQVWRRSHNKEWEEDITYNWLWKCSPEGGVPAAI